MEWTVDCGLNEDDPNIFEYLVPHWWNSVEIIRKSGHDLGGYGHWVYGFVPKPMPFPGSLTWSHGCSSRCASSATTLAPCLPSYCHVPAMMTMNSSPLKR